MIRKIITLFKLNLLFCIVSYGQAFNFTPGSGIANVSNGNTPPVTASGAVITTPDNTDGDATCPGSDPVSVKGDWFYNTTDLSYNLFDSLFKFTRHYHSTGEFNRSLGSKWSHNFDTYLLQGSQGRIVWVTPNGTKQTFNKQKNSNTFITGYSYYPILKLLDEGLYTLQLQYGNVYTFNNRGHLMTIQDHIGNTISCDYDSLRYLVKVTDPVGRSFTLTNDKFGRISTLTDPSGRSVKYIYNSNGNLTKVILPKDVIKEYKYDKKHRLTKLITPLGNIYTFIYDKHNRLIKNIDPMGYEEIFKYPKLLWIFPKNIQEFTNKRGNKFIYKYNNYGKILKQILPNNSVKYYKYNKQHNNTQVIYPNGTSITMEYDKRGNKIKQINQAGHTKNYTFSSINNKVTSITDAKENTSLYTYDSIGNMIKFTDAIGNSLTKKYNKYGLPIETKDAMDNITSYQYDKYGNTIAINNSIGIQHFTYDILGNVLSYIDAEGNTFEFGYDKLNRLTSVIDPLGGKSFFSYDKDNNLIGAIDANGNITRYGFNALKQMTSVKTHIGITSYNYDGIGNLISFTNAKGYITKYSYNYNSQLLSETTPLGNTSTFSYGINGNPIERIDAKGQITTYQYNLQDQLIKKTDIVDTVSYHYDKNSNMDRIENITDTIIFKVDPLNRVISKNIATLNQTIKYTYDKVSNKASMTNPDGGVTSYKYNAINQLTELVNPYGKTTTFEYTKNNLLKRQYNANNAYAQYTYNGLGYVTSIGYYNRQKHALGNIKYVYDKVGNRLSSTTNDSLTTTYIYDSVYQVSLVRYPNAETERFEYDKVGNRTLYALNDNVKTFIYNKDNNLVQAGNQTFIYDSNGNLIEEKTANSTRLFAYNVENKQVEITQNNSLLKSYKYNPLGQIRQEINNKQDTLQFIYDGVNVLQQSVNNIKHSYFTNGFYYDNRFSIYTNGKHYYYHTDALNSTTIITDDQEQVVNSYKYYAFGTIKQQIVKIDNPYTFTGRRYEDDINLYNYRNRYYNPNLARFITKDQYKGLPQNPITLNNFQYANNNPAKYIDPSGDYAFITYVAVTVGGAAIGWAVGRGLDTLFPQAPPAPQPCCCCTPAPPAPPAPTPPTPPTPPSKD